MIKAVFLDIDDTILDFEKCSSWSIYMAANRMRVYLPDKTQRIFMSVTDMLWKEMEAGRLTYDEIFEIRHDGERHIPYSDIISIGEEEDYIYLRKGVQEALVLPKRCLEGKSEELLAFIRARVTEKGL